MGVADFYSKLSGQEKKVLYAALGFIVLAVFDFLGHDCAAANK